MSKLSKEIFMSGMIGFSSLILGCSQDSKPKEILLESGKPATFGNVTAINTSRYGVYINPDGLKYWLKECGVNNLPGYRLTLGVQDQNKSGLNALMLQARDEGVVLIGVNNIARGGVLDNANQALVNMELAAGICGVANGSKSGREGKDAQSQTNAQKAGADSIYQKRGDFITGKVFPIVDIKTPLTVY